MTALHTTPEAFQQHVADCGERLGEAILDNISPSKSQHNWLEQLINRTISETDFRIQALRFIDVLPSLDDDQVLAEHLQEYFSNLQLPRIAEWGLKHTDAQWVTRIAAPTVRYTLRGLARKFMGGHLLHQAMTSISRLRHQKMNFTLDLLGEATISETESKAYQLQYLEMLDKLSEPVSNWNQNDLLDLSHSSNSPRLNFSIKLSSLYSQIQSVSPQYSILAICEKLRPILRSAIKNNAFITIDMEQYDIKNIVLGCFTKIIMEDEFKSWPHIGIAIQAYLKDSYDDIEQLIKLLNNRATPVTVRLVRGAYWDYETVIAKQNNWPCPVWKEKNDTDYNYEKCLTLLLNSQHVIHTAIATHNLRSIAFAIAFTEKLNLNKDQFEFQMLYGMADTLKPALVSLGYRLRIYVPYGETLPGMAYLVRRLLENASGQSMIDSGIGNNIKPINNYTFNAPTPPIKTTKFKSIGNHSFKNMPLLRFIKQQQCDDFKNNLLKVSEHFGENYPLIINGEKIYTEDKIESYNPSKPTQLIGSVSCANHTYADAALKSAVETFSSWKNTPVKQRADYLRRVASLLIKKRMEFSAWQVFEAGKNWQEADGDVCEAIDFLNYYADQAELILKGKSIDVSGEYNHINYKPYGVSLVIPPWNFPLAILCGMLSASIVTGNTCILKPSSLTPVVASKFMQLWQEVGIPDGVINFLPGPGKIVGEYLARKTEINIITFTGSLQVGTKLLSIGSHIQPGQNHIKKVIVEMGGKNAIIIDNDADLDDAVLGVVHSAFCFQGQKCSAASRVIVLRNIYKKFVKRLIETTDSLTFGSPEKSHNLIGPVIDKIAYEKILKTIQNARLFTTMYNYENGNNPDNGYYIKPCVFVDVDPSSPLAQEEIFGPVLSVIEADDFKQAVEIANNSRYALTGGVYSRQPSHLQYARDNFDVGNLYLNRKTTGALVGRHPFGGFKMSGAGSKAGGAGYLLQFMHTYCVSENTLRRGFAPEPDN
ncbi:MAG: 1-pyrroline-5-carboxylate dehydrogenase [endosymbiont of Galathealinum brachiosum]|uniref:Bifunctional protein PutA n=1 Tax=endosymbiont of Galathealinum brachiosum TaxID=2200906 RepID=A0A370DDX7_9GAMM|nr:MAG: 1-pyrroline-5-carboxylate dehydrogenase [endosymbiont of Galathealinum brachiosum]